METSTASLIPTQQQSELKSEQLNSSCKKYKAKPSTGSCQTKKPSQGSIKPNNVKSTNLPPENCILMHDLNKLSKHDIYIRHAVAKSHQQAIILITVSLNQSALSSKPNLK